MKFDGEMGRVEPWSNYTKLTLIGTVDEGNGEVYSLLSEPEVEDLIGLLKAALDPIQYVQVAAGTYPRLTYIDPSGELEVGDRVLVPMGYQNWETYGKVIALGRGTYTGPCKSVTALLEATELTA